MALEAGDRLGEYVLEARLGAGGFGEVWRARNPELDEAVAIKVPTDPAVADMLRREARLQHRLKHPAIVETLSLNVAHDPPYVVFRLVDGRSLAEIISERRTLPSTAAVAIVSRVLEALSHAHAEGIVHRDVKPSNILVAHDGRVLLTDFGLSVTIGPSRSLIRSGSASTSQQFAGTPLYMAPEQRRGEAATARSDLYSAGIVLYELLVGVSSRLRFPVPGAPAELSAAIDRATQDDAADRFESAHEMRRALPLSVEGDGVTLSSIEPHDEEELEGLEESHDELEIDELEHDELEESDKLEESDEPEELEESDEESDEPDEELAESDEESDEAEELAGSDGELEESDEELAGSDEELEESDEELAESDAEDDDAEAESAELGQEAVVEGPEESDEDEVVSGEGQETSDESDGASGGDQDQTEDELDELRAAADGPLRVSWPPPKATLSPFATWFLCACAGAGLGMGVFLVSHEEGAVKDREPRESSRPSAVPVASHPPVLVASAPSTPPPSIEPVRPVRPVVRAVDLVASARAHWDRGDRQRAIEDLNRAINLDPRHLAAYTDRARAKLLHLKDNPGSISDCDRAIELDPESAVAHMYRGLARIAHQPVEKRWDDRSLVPRWRPRAA